MTDGAITEDDLYRTSTQFRLWSHTEESLAALRKQTHETALHNAHSYTSEDVSQNSNLTCLTQDEELRLVKRYCEQIRTTNDHFKWPINIKATAVQYLKRFYLTNSCLIYPPKDIYKTVLFLASKTESAHLALAEYARRIASEPEQILAPEYKIIQALRFTLDVRQPYRGLKGTLMELLNMAQGRLPSIHGVHRTPAEVKQALVDLPAHDTSNASLSDGDRCIARIHAAYGTARTLLDGPALLSDAYLLFTPPQMSLAALYAADADLTSFYLSTKLDPVSPVTPKIQAAIKSCAKLLSAPDVATVMSKDERTELERRLDAWRDPSTIDLVGQSALAKRGGQGGTESAVDPAVAHRRQLERENSMKEGEDLFGPDLKRHGAAMTTT